MKDESRVAFPSFLCPQSSSLCRNDRLRLTLPHELIVAPVVCEVAKKFEVCFSIRRANVEPEAGWMDLQLEGDEAEIERAIAYMRERGVRVDPIEGDIIAG